MERNILVTERHIGVGRHWEWEGGQWGLVALRVSRFYPDRIG